VTANKNAIKHVAWEMYWHVGHVTLSLLPPCCVNGLHPGHCNVLPVVPLSTLLATSVKIPLESHKTVGSHEGSAQCCDSRKHEIYAQERYCSVTDILCTLLNSPVAIRFPSCAAPSNWDCLAVATSLCITTFAYSFLLNEFRQYRAGSVISWSVGAYAHTEAQAKTPPRPSQCLPHQESRWLRSPSWPARHLCIS
jgi:hypothetical protein